MTIIHRCFARDGRDVRCTLPSDQHQEITNSKGQRAIVHETKFSLWSVPVEPEVTDDDAVATTTND